MSEMLEGSLKEELSKIVNSDRVFTDLLVHEGANVMWYTPKGWEVAIPYWVPRAKIAEFCQEIDSDWENKIADGGIEMRCELGDAIIRISAYFAAVKRRLCLSIRRHPRIPMKLEQLGLSVNLGTTLDFRSKGLILLTGPTGAGKTTTLSSALDYINETQPVHIATVEDPIEMMFEPKRALISQKQVPDDVISFSRGLKDSLRQKPNVILVGELRDRETVETALFAATSGHLVFATLHNSSAIGGISKILSFFPREEYKQRAYDLSSSLIMVIAQALIPSMDGTRFVVAAETIFSTPQIAKTIAESDVGGLARIKDIAKVEDKNKRQKFLNDVLNEMVIKKTISYEEALRASYDPAGINPPPGMTGVAVRQL